MKITLELNYKIKPCTNLRELSQEEINRLWDSTNLNTYSKEIEYHGEKICKMLNHAEISFLETGTRKENMHYGGFDAFDFLNADYYHAYLKPKMTPLEVCTLIQKRLNSQFVPDVEFVENLMRGVLIIFGYDKFDPPIKKLFYPEILDDAAYLKAFQEGRIRSHTGQKKYERKMTQKEWNNVWKKKIIESFVKSETFTDIVGKDQIITDVQINKKGPAVVKTERAESD